MLNLNKCIKTKPKPTLIFKNCSYVCAYHYAQLSYTTQHKMVLIIFVAQMMFTGAEEHDGTSHGFCKTSASRQFLWANFGWTTQTSISCHWQTHATCCITANVRWPRLSFAEIFSTRKLHSLTIVWHCLHNPTFSHFSRTPTCDRQTNDDAHTVLAWHRMVKRLNHAAKVWGTQSLNIIWSVATARGQKVECVLIPKKWTSADSVNIHTVQKTDPVAWVSHNKWNKTIIENVWKVLVTSLKFNRTITFNFRWTGQISMVTAGKLVGKPKLLPRNLWTVVEKGCYTLCVHCDAQTTASKHKMHEQFCQWMPTINAIISSEILVTERRVVTSEAYMSVMKVMRAANFISR